MNRSVSARSRPITQEARDQGLRTFLSNVFLTMAFGLGATAIVSQYVVGSPEILDLLVTGSGAERSPSVLWWALTFAELGIVFFLAGFAESGRISMGGGLAIFAIYAAFNGLTMAPVLHLYTAVSVLKVFLITASTFLGCALWGYTTKRDLTGLGVFLVMGLWGLIVVMTVNLFLRSPAMDFLVTYAGVLVFAGLTAWDTQQLRERYDEQGATAGGVISGALALYLDFINLFLLFLRVFGVGSSSDD